MRALEFLEYVLVSSTITSSRHDDNKRSERIFTQQGFPRGQKSEIADQRLGQRLCQMRDWVRKVGLDVRSEGRVRGQVRGLS